MSPGWNLDFSGLDAGGNLLRLLRGLWVEGGAITPIATQNTTDFLNKTGFYYLGTVTTAIAASGATPANPGTTYPPTSPVRYSTGS